MVRYCEDYWKDVDKALCCVSEKDALDGKSIFITGATGMICSSVVDLLLRCNNCFDAGIKIILGGRSYERICARFAGFKEGNDFSFFPYDATVEQTLVPEADYIIHGAGNADPAALAEEPAETILANVTGLNNLLAAARNCKSKRLLYISSSEVYGTINESRAYREEDYGFVDILNPRAAYPCAKRAAEALCVAYVQEYGLDTVIVRPGHIYGPSITETDSRASAQFIRSAAKGRDIVMKSVGTQLRSYCYTLDCASAILTVLFNGEKGTAYNISNRDSVVTISDIAHALANVADTQVVYEDPSEMEKKSYNLMSNSSLNSEKLENLGWRAIFGLEEGAKRSIIFYKSAL